MSKKIIHMLLKMFTNKFQVIMSRISLYKSKCTCSVKSHQKGKSLVMPKCWNTHVCLLFQLKVKFENPQSRNASEITIEKQKNIRMTVGCAVLQYYINLVFAQSSHFTLELHYSLCTSMTHAHMLRYYQQRRLLNVIPLGASMYIVFN